MSQIRSRVGLTLLLTIAVLHYGGETPAEPALQKGEVVIDGRIKIGVEVARSPQAQAKGLGGRLSLKKGTGMLFPYDAPAHRAFWMKGMLIPLDILWIVGGKIVAIEMNIPPPSPKTAPAIYSHQADLVLEVRAGYVEEMGIRVGQSVGVSYDSVSR
ncbi:MAG: DUF192 domain-containing protein [Candidatus Methylomirabilis sp.]